MIFCKKLNNGNKKSYILFERSGTIQGTNVTSRNFIADFFGVDSNSKFK